MTLCRLQLSTEDWLIDRTGGQLIRASITPNRFSKHDQIGEVRIPLNTIDLAQTIEEWRNLTKVETDGGQVSKTKEVLNGFLFSSARPRRFA